MRFGKTFACFSLQLVLDFDEVVAVDKNVCCPVEDLSDCVNQLSVILVKAVKKILHNTKLAPVLLFKVLGPFNTNGFVFEKTCFT